MRFVKFGIAAFAAVIMGFAATSGALAHGGTEHNSSSLARSAVTAHGHEGTETYYVEAADGAHFRLGGRYHRVSEAYRLYGPYTAPVSATISLPECDSFDDVGDWRIVSDKWVKASVDVASGRSAGDVDGICIYYGGARGYEASRIG